MFYKQIRELNIFVRSNPYILFTIFPHCPVNVHNVYLYESIAHDSCRCTHVTEWIRRTPPSPHDLHYRWLDTQNRVSDLLGPSFVRDPSFEGKEKWNLNEVLIACWSWVLRIIIKLRISFDFTFFFRIIAETSSPFILPYTFFVEFLPAIGCYKRRSNFCLHSRVALIFL